jgi:hypothetical protein
MVQRWLLYSGVALSRLSDNPRDQAFEEKDEPTTVAVSSAVAAPAPRLPAAVCAAAASIPSAATSVAAARITARRRYELRLEALRSSHDLPTPRPVPVPMAATRA